MGIIFTMANSEQLRKNKNQHVVKNTNSKLDDKAINEAMVECIKYLQLRFGAQLDGCSLHHVKSIKFSDLISIIKQSEIRDDYDHTFLKRTIKPDGGAIFLTKDSEPSEKKIIIISETKYQGTNKVRIKEGKLPQAQGNAIERLGKNLTRIRAALNHEGITPFVCFGSGCDFVELYDSDSFVMSKISMLNEFYPLNKIYVFKPNGSAGKNSFSPVSMFFREERWTTEEMSLKINEIAETALRYYLH